MLSKLFRLSAHTEWLQLELLSDKAKPIVTSTLVPSQISRSSSTRFSDATIFLSTAF